MNNLASFLSVEVTLDHSNIAELEVSLTAPNSATVYLLSQTGAPAGNTSVTNAVLTFGDSSPSTAAAATGCGQSGPIVLNGA